MNSKNSSILSKRQSRTNSVSMSTIRSSFSCSARCPLAYSPSRSSSCTRREANSAAAPCIACKCASSPRPHSASSCAQRAARSSSCRVSSATLDVRSDTDCRSFPISSAWASNYVPARTIINI